MNNIYRLGALAGFSLLLTITAAAQDAAPKLPNAEAETVPDPRGSNPDDQAAEGPAARYKIMRDGKEDRGTGVVIRQKGNKDSKVTVEIHGGEVRINGKRVENYEDKNLSVRTIGPDDVSFGGDGPEHVYVSPFRSYSIGDQDMVNAKRSLELAQREMTVHQKQLSLELARANVERAVAMQDLQRQTVRANGSDVFLGVSSKKGETDGALVVDVTASSPAAKAGLKKGDVITKVNGKAIADPQALYEAIHAGKAGEKVKIAFQRDGKEKMATAVLEKSKGNFRVNPDMNFNYNFKMPGMTESYGGPYGEIVDDEGAPKIGLKAQDAEDGKGVDVISVADSSAALRAGLKAGDNIIRFDGEEVNSAEELAERVRDDHDKPVVPLTIKRDGKEMDLELHIPHKLKSAEL